MSDTKQFWEGEFGDQYTARNRVDWRARIPFWDKIIQKTGARSAMELGCNAGWNLLAMREVKKDIELSGTDVNMNALEEAAEEGLAVFPFPETISEFPHELVFSVGVLIHVAPEELIATMRRIVDASTKYVLAVEYESDQEEEIEYRGHTGKLWRRPYGKLYQEMGLTLVESGDAGEGFDKCTYWLLRK